jgi:hypothetical protein
MRISGNRMPGGLPQEKMMEFPARISIQFAAPENGVRAVCRILGSQPETVTAETADQNCENWRMYG